MADEREREIGQLVAQVANLNATLNRVEGKVDVLAGKIPEHESRLDQHQRELSSLWRWKDSMPMRMYAFIGAAATIVGGVVWIVMRLN